MLYPHRLVSHHEFSLSFTCSVEECEGGHPLKADQLLSEMEEEVLQTKRQDSLLCQGLKGNSGNNSYLNGTLKVV